MEAIVAVFSDWGIGSEGTQQIVLKADRAHFRALTAGAAVIVGRRTLGDFPGGRTLKGRENIVLTRQSIEIPGAVVVHGAAEALAEAAKRERVFVIGGASVYLEMFPHLDRIFVTKIDCAPHSDAFFPDLDNDPEWQIVDLGAPQEEDGLGYRFVTYERAAETGAD